MKTDCNLIVDLSNIVWNSYYGDFKPSTGNLDAQFLESLLVQETIKRILSYYRKFQATGMLIACDSGTTWRKSIYPEYKANRQKETILHFDKVMKTMNDLKTLFNEATNVQAISCNMAEGDDVIYVASKMSAAPTVIISSDKDFIQLLDGNTRLYAPVILEERKSEDVDYDLFVKCIRGDMADNVTSAYPRVRTTKLEEAFKNPAQLANMMNIFTTDGYRVGDLYKRNRKLIDLSEIPSYVKDDIEGAIRHQKPCGYSYIKLLKALKKCDVLELDEKLEWGSQMFQGRFLF